MEHLKDNAKEFFDSGEDNLIKKRFNAASSDFFKSVVVSCDYLIYCEIKRLPKNHADRFSILQIHFPEIYKIVSSLFKPYTDSYNLKSTKEDAEKFKEYAREIKKLISNKERA